MRLEIPELCMVVLVGASGSGKSHFAARHFKATEVLSSDACRALLCDDETDQSVSKTAFEVLHYLAARRLEYGKLTVIDATNVQPEARRALVSLARRWHVLPVAVVLDMPAELCLARNAERPNRNFRAHVVRNQVRALRRSLRHLKREGFRYVHVVDSPEQAASLQFERRLLWTNRRADHGPFDIIGDVHGCCDELLDLLADLGYQVTAHAGQDGERRYQVSAPAGRRVIFVGDLVDRGPASNEVLRLVMDMVETGSALCVPGNHEAKLLRHLNGQKVKLSHGLEATVAQLATESPAFHQRVRAFIDGLVSHYVLDDGKLVVAHAGMTEALQGRSSGRVRSFALYGETTGETDEFGLPVRYNWAQDYRGAAMVVYGHTPVAQAEWLNHTLCVDTGCVFGGKLTALRYPERELRSVAARRVYYEPVRPLHGAEATDGRSAQQAGDDTLDMADVLGDRYIDTAVLPRIALREENALAAVEALSRFGVHPKWLTYLPPTMSPAKTGDTEDYLEHPEQALAYYRTAGVEQIICEEKHMGSRVIVHVCRDAAAARRRFGVTTGESGICYTRTGRRFFQDLELERALLTRLQNAIQRAGLWQTLATDWLSLDCELMPWSLKAVELIRNQYAAVGAAAAASLSAALESLQRAAGRGQDVDDLLVRQGRRLEQVNAYRAVYRPYCWEVDSLEQLRLAPFHLLASEGRVHTDRDHLWHLRTLALLADLDSLFVATAYETADLSDPDSELRLTDWWETLTERGGEGMVVKPLGFLARGTRGYVQPALKCRGREYLRLIYGPEYDTPDQLEKLRKRNLGAKRRLAMQEFSLGLEGLQRFVDGAPLRRVHECVLGVLALESEPVDPRL